MLGNQRKPGIQGATGIIANAILELRYPVNGSRRRSDVAIPQPLGGSSRSGIRLMSGRGIGGYDSRVLGNYGVLVLRGGNRRLRRSARSKPARWRDRHLIAVFGVGVSH